MYFSKKNANSVIYTAIKILTIENYIVIFCKSIYIPGYSKNRKVPSNERLVAPKKLLQQLYYTSVVRSNLTAPLDLVIVYKGAAGSIDGHRATRNGTTTTTRTGNHTSRSSEAATAGHNTRKNNSTVTRTGRNPNRVYSTTAG